MLGTALLLEGFAFAQQQDFSKVQIKVTKVAGMVYMLEGSGGNIGVSVGDDGIVIVDDQFAPLAPRIKEALKSISDKPLKFVLNTHFHFDHTGGNVQFGAEAPIIAQENVRRRLKEGSVAAGVTTPPAPKKRSPSSPSTTAPLSTSMARTSAPSIFPTATQTATVLFSSPNPKSYTWATTSLPAGFRSST